MPSTLVILGCGRGSAELIDLLQASTQADGDLTLLDDDVSKHHSDLLGVPCVGALSMAPSLASSGARFICGIASGQDIGLRRRVCEGLPVSADSWHTYIDRAATVSPTARVERGSIVYPGARIGVQAKIGKHCAIYYNVVVHHDVVIGDGSILCSSVSLAGHVRVGQDSYLGVGSAVKQGVTIGERVLVGMGAVVTRDVPDGTVVVGVPAKKIRSGE